MRKDDLRPIGSEFWHAFPMSTSNSCAQNRFLYRIVAHDEVEAPSEFAERLEAIAMQSRQMNGIKFVQLSDRVVEDYTFEDWGEIQWKEGEVPHVVKSQ